MAETGAHIRQEIREAPDAVRRQQDRLARPIADLAGRLRDKPPRLVVTCARGTSAHAATFGKYLIERRFGIPVASAAPSITSVYGRSLKLDGQLLLVLSQSGRSDDLVEQAVSARQAGALTVALVNAESSPLADQCEIVLPLGAGPELSVAATKSFVAMLAALLRLTAAWAEDATLGGAVARLPDRLAAAAALDWTPAARAFRDAANLITIGRGPTLAIAREAALKLKETCDLHAEAFSGAEFLHGPVSLISRRYPVLLFLATDESEPGLRRLAERLRAEEAGLFVTADGEGEGALPVLPPDHPDADAVCLIQSFYGMAVELAALRGTDADRPRHLSKVTRTR